MKEEYEQYELQRMLLNVNDFRAPLSSLVNLDIQKPTKGAGYGISLPEEKEEDEFYVCHKKTD